MNGGCDDHAKQVQVPTVDGDAVMVCEGCMAICGPADPLLSPADRPAPDTPRRERLL